ncbi:MAG: isoprenylcysteine carboxylmethyltransferase family protein, partial [Phycisphaerales bacterium]
PGPQLATSFLLWATLVASFASSSHTGPGVQRAATAIGVTAVLLGAWLRVTAIRTLGERFLSSPAPLRGAELETRGVYAHLRHPSETGIVLIACGAVLATLSPVALVLATGLAALVWWRVRVEDRHLRTEFGPAHAHYVARVPGLVPWRGYSVRATHVR